MSQELRLSDHPLSQQWLLQFRSSRDRALAAQLLNQLVLVSTREFEARLEEQLTALQTRLNATIAVYPIAPPIPSEIVGYDPFSGGIPRAFDSHARTVGKRRKYGSEDRVGHLLAKLQEMFKQGSGSSRLECVPTLAQLKTQGIRHIVLVDDVCGSGRRITSYWRSIPRRIKSLLSFKRCELWIVLYTITSSGRKALKKAIPNFPIDDHLITVLPDADLMGILSPEIIELCQRYATEMEMKEAALGYEGSMCPVVFEHGCPNNLPVVLWANKKSRWSGLFPNCSIPTELRPYFDEEGVDRLSEQLWKVNQPKLAVELLDDLERSYRLTSQHRLMLTLLGLRLRGVGASELARRVLTNETECQNALKHGEEMGLYNFPSDRVTKLGEEFIRRFRERSEKRRSINLVGENPATYYPAQCEGNFRKLGKTV